MNPERWRQIEGLFHAALERELGMRLAFLEKASGDDVELRREVESLLAQDGATFGNLLDSTVTRLAAGTQLGPYKIEGPIGAGGMGQVFKAVDTRLGRAVAIKITDENFSSRFEREARAISALNHPNICTLHDVGPNYLVMELVEGETLAARLRKGPLKTQLVMRYGAQVAHALAAAHSLGIIHRDLKPGNIMVTKNGVKVLDFGLAKLVEHGEVDELAATKTMGQRTEQGTIVGTAAYMSPEQAEGKPVDARSDIFSFGSVLYEMVTGRRPFQGETTMATLTAILHLEPKPVGEIAEGVPRELERIITYCLRKDRERRYQHMDDIKISLEGLKAESDSGELTEAAGRPTTGPRRLGWVLAVSVTLAAVGAGTALWMGRSREPAAQAPLLRLTSDTGLTTDPALSPDGKFVAYSSDRAGGDNLDIWVKQVEGGTPLRLTSDPADESMPSFSPDGNRIVFRSERDGGAIYMIPALGGEPRLIAQRGREPRFSPDGASIAFASGGGGRSGSHRDGLFVVPSVGGAPQRLVADEIGAANPVWSPDGKFILFETGMYRPDDWGLVSSQAGSQASPIIVSLAVFKKKTGLADIVPYEWLDGNRILFSARSGDSSHLFETVLSPPALTGKEWRLDPSPKRLTAGTGQDERPSLASGGFQSSDRRLAFASLVRSEHIWSLDLDTNQPRTGGKIQLLTQESGFQIFPSISRDGTKLAFLSHAAYNDEVWLLDLKTGKRLLLSNKVSVKFQPVIHSDGSRVMYSSEGALFAVSPSGGAPEELCDRCGWSWDWSSDHKRILSYGRPKSSVVVAILNLETGKQSVFLERPGKDLIQLHWSPDGRWIVFCAAQAGRSQVFVAPYTSDQGPSETAWIPITDGSTDDEGMPSWSPNGNWIYLVSSRDGFRCLWAYPVDPRTKRPAGKATAVFHAHGSRVSLRNANLVSQEMSVARDKIVFNQGEITGNIWMTELRDQK